MASLSDWIQGARPRTLPTAIAPVAVGTGLAIQAGHARLGLAVLALVVALALQVGVNYANDYSDGIRGTDEVRVGPVRLVGQRLASPSAVKRAAFGSFAVAMLAGLVIVVVIAQWWLLIVGAACVAAAWLYTGGSRPYGYLGLGELFVFVFFGPVPVLGTMYAQTLSVNAAAVWASVGVGFLACAVLVANNLRDIPTDVVHGKRTLAVRLGDTRTRHLYTALIVGAVITTVVVAGLLASWIVIVVAVFGLALPPLHALRQGASGPALIPVLKTTGLLVLGYGLALGLAIALA